MQSLKKQLCVVYAANNFLLQRQQNTVLIQHKFNIGFRRSSFFNSER